MRLANDDLHRGRAVASGPTAGQCQFDELKMARVVMVDGAWWLERQRCRQQQRWHLGRLLRRQQQAKVALASEMVARVSSSGRHGNWWADQQRRRASRSRVAKVAMAGIGCSELIGKRTAMDGLLVAVVWSSNRSARWHRQRWHGLLVRRQAARRRGQKGDTL